MYITKKNGKIVNNQEYMDWIMTSKDGTYKIVEDKPIRTLPQNRYLHGGVYKAICDHTGYDKEYVHAIMGMKFLVDNTGKMPYVKSTTSLTTAEMVEYIENIKNFMSEFGVIILSSEDYFSNNE